MEEAPSMSDGDVCISATSQSPRLASGAVSGGFLALAFLNPLALFPSFFLFLSFCTLDLTFSAHFYCLFVLTVVLFWVCE